jgi:hypothetical protein
VLNRRLHRQRAAGDPFASGDVEAGAEFIGAQDRLLRRLVIDDLKLPVYDTYGDKAGQGSPIGTSASRRP